MGLHAGDWIEIKSKEEILATLDDRGRREGLPFMPEMLFYCGRRVRIESSAHKTCGPVQGRYIALQTNDLLHLGFRCDGSAHDGCQNRCQIFWHKDWLRPDGAGGQTASPPSGGFTEAALTAATRQPDLNGEKRYSCQALDLKEFTKPLSWLDPRAYWKSYRTRNHTLKELVSGIAFILFSKVVGFYGQRFGARRLYDAIQSRRGGTPFPRRHGLVPDGQPTPVVHLGLKAGEYVSIKSHEEIVKTLTHDGKNRGMFFDAEFAPYCGRIFRVEAMVERFIDEEVGVMRHMKTPAAILENVHCRALYAGRRAFCTRGYCVWWREAWLERVPEAVYVEEGKTPSKARAHGFPSGAALPLAGVSRAQGAAPRSRDVS